MDDRVGFTILPSAYKHSVDDESMLNVIASPISSYYYDDRSVVLVLGFDKNGDTIEVAYDLLERKIFHAMPIRHSEKRQR